MPKLNQAKKKKIKKSLLVIVSVAVVITVSLSIVVAIISPNVNLNDNHDDTDDDDNCHRPFWFLVVNNLGMSEISLKIINHEIQPIIINNWMNDSCK